MAEPENAHLRNVLREIVVHCNNGLSDPCPDEPGGGDENDRLDLAQAKLALIREHADEALKRPRTNDRVIDDLERQVGDLTSKLVDMQMLRAENATLQFQAVEATRQMRIAFEQLEAVRAASQPRMARAAAPETDAAKYLTELGARLRRWSEDGVMLGAHRAAEIEQELLALAAGLGNGNLEEQAVATAADRERLLYWLCRIYCDFHGDLGLDDELDALLTSFGYSPERRRSTVKMGEPGRSRQPGPCPATRFAANDTFSTIYDDDCQLPEDHQGDHAWRCGVCRERCKDIDLAALDQPFVWDMPASIGVRWSAGDPRNDSKHAYLDLLPLCEQGDFHVRSR